MKKFLGSYYMIIPTRTNNDAESWHIDYIDIDYWLYWYKYHMIMYVKYLMILYDYVSYNGLLTIIQIWLCFILGQLKFQFDNI